MSRRIQTRRRCVTLGTLVCWAACYGRASETAGGHAAWRRYTQAVRSDPSLVVYYDFEDGAGMVLRNRAKPTGTAGKVTGPDGKLGGGKPGSVPAWSTGRWPEKGALRFDGVNDVVDSGNSTLFDGDTLSIEVWFCADPSAGAKGALVDKAYWGGRTQYGYGLHLRGPSRVQAQLVDERMRGHYCRGRILPGTWCHAVLVHDYARGSVALYVNGELVGRDAVPGFRPALGYTFAIGRHQACRCWHFKGKIDELAVYKRALSEKEIKRRFRIGCPEDQQQGDAMKTSSTNVLAALAAGLLTATPASGQDVPEIDPPRLSTAPTIDGRLDDGCWEQAAQVTDFAVFRKGGRAQAQTRTYLGYDDRALYVGWRCEEPDTPALVAEVNEHDGPISLDDCVELFLAPGTDGASYYHFLVNSRNARAEKWRRTGNQAWDGYWSSAVHVGKSAWTVEMAIPWYNFCELLSDGPWRINFGREKRSQPGEISSWSFCDRGFHQPKRFGRMTTPDVDFSLLRNLRIYDPAVGSYKIKEQGYSYDLSGNIMNRGTTPRSVSLEAVDIPRTGPQVVQTLALELPAGKVVPFTVTLDGLDSLELRRACLVVRDAASGMGCYVKGLAAGSFPALMQAYFDRSYYTAEKAVTAIVGLNVPRTEGVTYRAELEIMAGGPAPIVKRATVTNPERTEIHVPADEVPLGDHECQVCVYDAGNKTIAQEALRLRRHEGPAEGILEVKIDRDARVPLVDGKSFFPIGIYGIPEEHMKVCAEAGFNCSIRWSPGARLRGRDLKEAMSVSEERGRAVVNEYLDACAKAGLLTLDWPLRFSYERLRYAAPGFGEACARFLEDPLPFVIETIKSHPALLSVYGLDEPGEQHRALCRQFSETIWALDPYHPVYLLACRKVVDWPEVYDVAGMDWYGSGGRGSQIRAYKAVKRGVDICRKNRVPYWHVPMCETYSGSSSAIDGDEQRAQTYACVAAGAQGMLWFVWPPRGRDNWMALKQVAQELGELAPVLLSATPDQQIRQEPQELGETVQVLVTQHNASTYLVAVNVDPRPVEAEFSLPASMADQATVLFEDRTVKVTQGRFSDAFPGFARHVYRIESSWPEQGVVSLKLRATGGRAGQKPDPATPVRNLVVNAGFEDDEGWSFVAGDDDDASASGGFSDESPHKGKRYARIDRSVDRGRSLFAGKPLLLEPRTKYSFGGYAFSEGGAANFELMGQGEGGEFARELARVRVLDRSPGWSHYFTHVETADEPVRVRPVCILEGGPANASFDDVYVKAVGETVGRNLVRNSGFERQMPPGWPAGWVPSTESLMPGIAGGREGLWGTDTNEVFEGEYSLRMTKKTDVQDNIETSYRRTEWDSLVDVTKHYTHSLYMKADRPGLDLRFIGGAHNVTHFKPTTEWKRYTFTVYERPGAQRYFRWDLILSEPGTIWIDAVQFEQAREATPYVEGR